MTETLDLVILNGRVLTMDPDRPSAQAVGIAGGRIVMVGDDAELRDRVGPATTIVDAEGGSVLPGFIEAHMHIFAGAAELVHLQLAGTHGLDALAEAVSRYAIEQPETPLLVAQGADYTILGDDRPVTREILDGIVADRPFVMVAPDHHTMWANTAALERAGILRGRQLPPGNEIVLGAGGLATGELREHHAFDPVMALAGIDRSRIGLSTGGEPEPSPSAVERAADRKVMERGLAWCARHGITSFHNMDGNFYQLELLDEIEAEGRLTSRARVPFHLRNGIGLDALDKASAMAARWNSDWISSGFVKVFIDGVIESGTAVMIEPYADQPGWRGDPLFSAEEFAALAVEADRRGLQIAVHAIGDGAVRTVLDGYAEARRRNGPRDSRHRIEHVELTTTEDIARFADLGVIASMQPTHVPGCGTFPLEPTLSRIGASRWPVAYPVRSLLEAAVAVAFASDWPVAPISPLLGMRAATTRMPWAEDLPEQRLTLHEAIAAYTIGGAYAEFSEGRKGRVKPGFLADVAVLSSDISATPPQDLGVLDVAVTICGGRIVWQP